MGAEIVTETRAGHFERSVWAQLSTSVISSQLTPHTPLKMRILNRAHATSTVDR
jgi:hypothetical protein